MDAGRCAGIFAERPTEWIVMSNPSAGNQRVCNYVYMYMSALLCGYTRHLRTCRYVAIAANRTQGVKFSVS